MNSDLISALLTASEACQAAANAARDANRGDVLVEVQNAGWCIVKALAVELKRASRAEVQP